ncbi:hypothetical protein M2302_002227 [Micromonospora sp. A200]|uniref:Gp37-like protein n=1 Tax=Micromonospora sp. A200 TaxID=2940568 RepID=UPI002476DFE1|nr:hypothetical protein [Micromonospora sp. A200]MDH6462052.1 hypothetical protein [Micromonospora sp. A200]
MRLQDITVEVRDRSLVRLGLIRPEDLDLQLEDLHNNVGSWTLKLASEHPLAGALRQPGAGIVVTGPDGKEMFSGPTVKPENAATAEDPGGTITFEGVDDTVLLADALAVPDPSDPHMIKEWGTKHDQRTGPAETLMHQFVNANIGPGAPAERRSAALVSRLRMGTDHGRGPTVTKSARFKVLGNLVGELAVAADLGFRIIQRGDYLHFETYSVADRSDLVRLDIYHSTLAGHRVAMSPPGTTRVIVAGNVKGGARHFEHVTTSSSTAAEADWGRRIEKFLENTNAHEGEELEQTGLEVLADEGFTSLAVQVVPMEDSAMDFGTHWNVGDQVAVVVEGQEVKATVTGYVMKVDQEGFRLGVVLGDPTGFNADAALSKRVKGAEARISALESAAKTTGTQILNVADYQDQTEPANYPQGESLVYISDASIQGWPFGFQSGPVRTQHPAGDGKVTQTWQNHTGVFQTPEMKIRSGVEGYGFTDWHKVALVETDIAGLDGRLDTLEGARYLGNNTKAEADAAETYPLGVSHLSLGAGSGWSVNGGYGTVVTHSISNYRCTQICYDNDGDGMWKRFYHTDQGGWSQWKKLAFDNSEVLTKTGALTAGNWYRIGTIPGVQNVVPNKAAAEFTISTTGSGQHAHIRIKASPAYYDREGAHLRLEEFGGYNSAAFTAPPFTQARLIPIGSTYDGFHLEVKAAATPSDFKATLTVKHDDWTDGTRWVPVNFAQVTDAWSVAQQEWHTIGMYWTGRWTLLSLINGWANYSGGYPFAEFKMHPGSLVEVRGLVKNGTADVAILPEGCRPRYRLMFPSVAGGNGLGRLDVTNVGAINRQAGQQGSSDPTQPQGFMSLEAIRFTAEW